MDNNLDHILEEILLGYLRGSKKIELANIEEIPTDTSLSTVQITFKIDKTFGKTLIRSLNSKSQNFFN